MAIVTLAEFKQTQGLQHVQFVGSGLDDLTPSGIDDNTPTLTYRIQIDGTGTPDTFKWSDDGGNTWDAETVNITGSAQSLNNGVQITFGATTGHTSGDYWQFATGNLKSDTALTQLIEDAQADFESATHRVFEDPGADATRYYDCKLPAVDGIRLYLDKDLASITSITNGDDVALESDDYVTQPRNSADGPFWAIDLRSDSGVSWTYTDHWENAITVVGRWWYGLESDSRAETEVKSAIRVLAKYYYEVRGAVLGVLVAPTGEEYRIQDNWPQYVQTKLRKYRRV